MSYTEVILFASHDHEFVSTVANRIIEIAPTGFIDRMMGFDEYLEDAEVTATREALCNGHAELSL
jgi:ATPase subunit of ABC transporter with duplicated ATPase domains